MGCRILFDRDSCRACLYDSVTESAFGPCFVADDADAEAENFMSWLGCDPRILKDDLLRMAHAHWHRTHHNADGDWMDGEFVADDEAIRVLGLVQDASQEFERKRRSLRLDRGLA